MINNIADKKLNCKKIKILTNQLKYPKETVLILSLVNFHT